MHACFIIFIHNISKLETPLMALNEEGLNKPWCTPTVDYYSEMQRNELLICTTTLLDLWRVTLYKKIANLKRLHIL